MNLLNKVTRMLVIGALLTQGSLSHAVTSLSAQAQAASILQIQMQYKAIADQQDKITKLSDLMAQAVQDNQGGWQIEVEASQFLKTWGNYLFKPATALATLTYLTSKLSSIPELVKVTNPAKALQKPSMMVLAVGSLALVVGFGAESYGHRKLTIAKAQMDNFNRQIEVANKVIETNKAAILMESEKIGATVRQNVISFEGLEGLKMLGGNALNTIDLNK